MFPNEHFKYIDISAVDKDAKTVVQTQEVLGREAPSRARKVVRAGDILVSTVRPNLNAVAIVPGELDGQIASTGFCVLRPNPKALKSRFLFYRTVTPEFVSFLAARMRGANYPAVTDGVVKKALIPLPPLSEQQRIVEILDQADTLRKKRAEADARAERILPALFLKMFGDPATNPMGWEKVRLGNLLVEPPQNGLYKPSEFYGEQGVAILRIDSFYNDRAINLTNLKRVAITAQEVQRYALHPNNIVVNRVNSLEYLGKCALIPELAEPTVFESNMMRLSVRDDLVNPVYLIRHLQTPAIRRVIQQKAKQAINQASINQSDVQSFPIILPPQNLQLQFALHATSVEKAIQQQKISEQEIGQLFSMLLHRAFSGNLTAQWREGHMKELLEEMENQSKVLSHLEMSPC